MLDVKLETLLTVAEQKNFTRAAELLNLTQPAVSHHINQLEQEYKIKIFTRYYNKIKSTEEGKIIIKYAKILKAMNEKLHQELKDVKNNLTKLRIGLTHTSESSLMTQVLAKYANDNQNINITILTDTIKNLYKKLENYEIDIAIIDGRNTVSEYNSIMLDTDYLICAIANDNPLAKNSIITLDELKKERLVLRLPSSNTRMLFESTLHSIGESISAFDIAIEVDNVSTIKDIVIKGLGVSILPKSVCLNEIRKKKLTVLPIENLSMARETNLVYHKSFEHTNVLQCIADIYHATITTYNFK